MNKTIINISDLREPINVSLNDYPDLVDSIRDYGVIQPIYVTPNGLIIDGRGRYLAAKEVGLKEIPCYVIEYSDPDRLEYEMITSKHHIETDPIEYAKALKRLINAYPEMTLEEVARKLDKSVGWVQKKLSLLEEK